MTLGDNPTFIMIVYETLFFYFFAMQASIDGKSRLNSPMDSWAETILLKASSTPEDDDYETRETPVYLGDLLSAPHAPIFVEDELNSWVDTFIAEHKNGIFGEDDLEIANLVLKAIAGTQEEILSGESAKRMLQMVITRALRATHQEALMIERPKQFVKLDGLEF